MSLRALAAAACAAALAAAPQPAGALALLDAALTLEPRATAATLAVAAVAADEPAAEPSLDFDLLGPPKPVAPVDDPAMRRRGKLLAVHQAVGLGLVAIQLANTTAGQLNYLDKYGTDASLTGRYELTHTVLAYTNVGVFAASGVLALLAPDPKEKPKRGFGRVSLHKLAVAVASAGMLAQGALGIYTDRREGYENQERWAKAHLAIGYATLAALGVSVGALVW